jgi:hypothetical protein
VVVSEGGVRCPIADELSVRVRDPGSNGRTRIGEPRRKVGDGLWSDRLAAVAGSERSIDPSEDIGVHVTDGLGAASELLGCRAALVESAQVQAGVATGITRDRANDVWPETVHRVPVSPPA